MPGGQRRLGPGKQLGELRARSPGRPGPGGDQLFVTPLRGNAERLAEAGPEGMVEDLPGQVGRPGAAESVGQAAYELEGGNLPGDRDRLDGAEPLAGAGDGRCQDGQRLQEDQPEGPAPQVDENIPGLQVSVALLVKKDVTVGGAYQIDEKLKIRPVRRLVRGRHQMTRSEERRVGKECRSR